MADAIHAVKPLTTRSAKRGPGERKRGHYQDAITPQAFMLAPASVGPKTSQTGLLEAVSQRESEQPASGVSQCTPTLKQGSGAGLQRSNAAGENQSPGLGPDLSYRRIAYNEYLAQAFRLSPADKGKVAEEQDDCATEADALPSPGSHLSATSMELSFRLSLRERRPKIQLTIPRTKSKTYAAIPQGEMKGHGQDTPEGASPPSTISRNQGNSRGAPVGRSVMSPLSVVEMPRPRRPFSTFSFEEMTDGVPNGEPNVSKSASSDSSDDTGEHDGKFSTHSPQSSVSSLASDPTAVKPTAVNSPIRASSAMSPAVTTGLDPKLSASKTPRHPRGKRSMKSLNDGANRNKPLPPPPGPDAVKPLNYSTHSLPRTNSMQASRTTPRPGSASRQSSLSISSHKSLRSKYTPTDRDAGDNVLKRSGSKNLDPPPRALLGSPTLSQAELELEAHLCSIEEDFPLSAHEVPPIHDPLQISRGPMHMEPSRNPPSPPPSQTVVESPLPYGKTRTKRSVTHVAMQMRPGKQLPRIPRKRVSAPVVWSNDKAHRVLGSSCSAAIMTRDTSADSRWKPSGSPHSSPNLSMDDPETPPSERSPLISNATFEEVRQRVELFTPKSDALQDFLEFHQQNRSSGAVTPPRPESNARKPPSNTKSINSPTRLIEAARREQGRAVLGHHQTVPHPPIQVTPVLPERHIGRLEPRKRHDRSSTSSRSSTAAKIPAIGASLPSPRLAEEEADGMLSAAAAEKVLLRILENLGNLQDLFATASVTRGFYRTFKRHELHLMKNALYAMSPAAWELRETSPPLPKGTGKGKVTSAASMGGYTPRLYLQRYENDMYIMVALKSMILTHCESFLRADTITALAGGETERASHIDDAFWRIWTFCRLFGCDSKKENDIVYQMDWLRGGTLAREQRRTARTLDQSDDSSGDETSFNSFPAFGQGNYGGLSAEELYDMIEIWTCLGVLVSGLQGKRELAREFGVFENSNIPEGDIKREDSVLEEWTYHLLTLAPPTILDVTCPTTPNAATFAHARSRGYTSWSPPSEGDSRSTFLKEAVSRVYQEKIKQSHPIAHATSPQRSLSATSGGTTAASRQRMAEEIQAKRKDPGFKALLPSEDRPMSNFPEVLRKLEKSSVVSDDSSSTATISSLAPSSQPVASGSGPTTPSASLHPIHSPSPSLSIRDEMAVPVLDACLSPQVRDPVDIALERLIEMGFDKKIAVKALADTDTGNNVDFDRALETLVRQRKRDVSKMPNWNYGGPAVPEMSRGPERRASPKPAVGLGIRGVERYA